MKIFILLFNLFICFLGYGQTDTSFTEQNKNYVSRVYPQLRHGIEFSVPNNPDGLIIMGIQQINDYSITIKNNNDTVVFHTTDASINWFGMDHTTGAVAPDGTYSYQIKADDVEISGSILLKQ